MSKRKLPSDTFCALPWMHLSTRPDGNMRVCCTANASSHPRPVLQMTGLKTERTQELLDNASPNNIFTI